MPYLDLPNETYKQSFLNAATEMQACGEGDRKEAQVANETFGDYLKYLASCREGKNLKPGYVPDTVYWLIDEGEYIGRVSIRHYLTKELEELGGHIGYLIRPTMRKKGYGKEILRLALEKARDMGLSRVLLTCDEDNTASIKIIETHGGKFESKVEDNNGGAAKLRYWIDL
jgi:predicted acetyltransferase